MITSGLVPPSEGMLNSVVKGQLRYTISELTVDDFL